MKHRSLSPKFRYLFENLISSGPVAIIALLAFFSGVVVVLSAAVICVTGLGQSPDSEMTIFEAAWQSLMRTMDAGTVAGDTGWGFRMVMFLVTLCGIFVVSILIGTITTGLEEKLQELRKGRSKVFEKNHTIILGWSSKVHSIVSELVIANTNQKNPRIVVLAPKDKVEMEDEIRARLPDPRNTKVICRTGSPLDLTDLEVVSPYDARSIIVLSSEGEDADTDVIKTLLALTNNPSRTDRELHIVAEIQDPKNLEAAELVGRGETRLVLSSDLISKVTAQTCRQSGLSLVYTELLDFDGAEIYFAKEPSLTGKTYKEALLGFEQSTVIGVRKETGTIVLNPAPSTLLEAGDSVIAISLDDDTVVFTGTKEVQSDGIVTIPRNLAPSKERTLVLGWNDRGWSIVSELDHYVARGSEVLVVTDDTPDTERKDEFASSLTNQTVSFQEGDTTDRKTLDGLNVETFDHIIVLCSQNLALQKADARTLVTLLHLRSISQAISRDLNIVSEMLDMKNRELAEVSKADDFIVSDRLVSLMLSQLSENGELQTVFNQLFASEGSEIYLKPVEDYFKLGQSTDFYALVESAARRGETAIGYRKQALAHDPKQSYGVVVNPGKRDAIVFDPEDRLIVLAES